MITDMITVLIITFVLMSLASIFLLIKCAIQLKDNDEEIFRLKETSKMLNNERIELKLDLEGVKIALDTELNDGSQRTDFKRIINYKRQQMEDNNV